MTESQESYLISDIFRRADKNDDNALSWQEFKSFFADGVLSEEELNNLFHEIDTHNTNNLDCGELTAYFSTKMGAFKDVFGTIGQLNSNISQSLMDTSKAYPEGEEKDRFVTRFLLREVLTQLSAVIKQVDNAADHLDEEAQRSRGARSGMSVDAGAVPAHTPTADTPPGQITPGRVARRARRQYSAQLSWPADKGASSSKMDVSGIAWQVDRLKGLLDKFEKRVTLSGATEEELSLKGDKQLVVVQRKLTAREECGKQIQKALRAYTEAANDSQGCEHVSVRAYASPPNTFMVHEIWNSHEDRKVFCQSDECRAFQHAAIDVLETPEVSNSITIPHSWWPRD